jgi:DNA-binding beta-propeller fold protein YncE
MLIGSSVKQRVVSASACLFAGLALILCPTAMGAGEKALLSSFGSFSHPTGVAVDRGTGNVYVADGGGPEAIDVFGSDGGPPSGGAPAQLTGAATPAGSFEFHSEPVGVAVDNSAGLTAGDIYVTDVAGGGEHEVLDRFRLNGTGEFEYLSQLTGFGEPIGTTVDAEGSVYVSDYGHGVVHEFDASGTELAQFSSPLIAHPQGVAVDAAGDIYVQGYGVGNLVELKRASASSPLVLAEVEVLMGGVTAIAVDRAANLVLVDLGSAIAEYDAEGHLLGQFGAEDLGESLGLAVDEASGKVYVSDAGRGRTDIFGVPPLLAPTVAEQFSVNVGSSSAELRAQITPNLRDTRYTFQFGVDASYTGGEVPAPLGGDAGAGGVARAEHAILSGLAPATTYHYRVKAVNAAGTTFGPDTTFTTFALAPFALPDNRAWEMISPPEKNGGNIAGIRGDNGGGVVQAAPTGDAITFVSVASFGDPQGAPSGSQYLATREPGGWSTRNITAPLRSDTYFRGGAGTPYKAFSNDLSLGLLPNAESPGRVENPPLEHSGAPPGYSDLYLRETGGGNGTLALLTAAPEETAEEFFLTFKASTPDLSHVVMSTPAALVPRASRNPEGNLYEWSSAGLQAVNVLPGAAEGETAPGRALLGSGQNEGNVISEDGSRVFWSYEEGSELHLLVRENGSSTIRLDAAKEGPGLNPGESQLTQLWAASTDGSKAFFASDAPLTGNANTGPPCGVGCRREGNDLYVFDLATHGLLDLTPDATDVNGASVQGVLGASSDGSRVYFIANAALVGANGEGRAPLAGGENLYVWHEGEGTTFIATLSSDDQSGSDELGNPNDWDPSIGRRTTRVTPDGLRLAFMSDASLTGYDNVDANTGARDEQVYLYDAGARRLLCASCNPSRGRPVGPSLIPGGTIFSNEGRGGEALHQSRALSADGSRLFFDSNDALVPQDVNGKRDVYEYENAQAHLLSGGTSDEDSSFLDAGANGDDAFLITRQRLVGQDADQLIDLYDARVGGGFPEAPPGAPCQGEGCRLPATPAPSFGFPATTALGAVGNLPAVGKPAAKGHTKAKHRRHKRHKRHKRKAKRTGRGR